MRRATIIKDNSNHTGGDLNGHPSADEFESISRFFEPLARDRTGALALKDDAALLTVSPGKKFVVATDALVAGVHFFAFDPPDLIARKLIRVNISDIVAMGATPKDYLLVLILPNNFGDEWLEKFSLGLLADQSEFDISLVGGDTVQTKGPLMLAVTMMGTVDEGKEVRRQGAKVGSTIYVSGTIGDAALGLKVVQGGLENLDEKYRQFLLGRYHLPQPRVLLGRNLFDVAQAAIDISDGLAADLFHICRSSQVSARIDASALPLSAAARAALDETPELMETILTGGDDYELIFTVSDDKAAHVEALAANLGYPLTPIGKIVAVADKEPQLQVVDDQGKEIILEHLGYIHF